MVPAHKLFELVGDELLGAALFLCERVTGCQDPPATVDGSEAEEDRYMRCSYIRALPVFAIGAVFALGAITFAGVGRCLRPGRS